MRQRVFAAALLAVFLTGCGGEGRITEPRAVTKPTVLNAIGTDPISGATIETSQDDYAPSEKVHVTGRGWAPNETVTLFMTEDPDTHADVSMDVQADSIGGFSVHFYDVQLDDIGAVFTLTATGRTSGSVAIATFTDGTIANASIEMRDGATCTSAQGTVAAGSPICAHASFDIIAPGATDAQFRWKSPSGTIVQISQRTPGFPSIATGAQTFDATYTPTTAGTWTVLLCQSNNNNVAPGGVAQCASGSEKASQTFQVTAVTNTAPVLGAIGNKNGDELTQLTFTATATDDGLPNPPAALSYSLDSPASGTFPTGAAITSGGVFTWTPTEAQGPGTYRVKVVVSDGALTDFEEIEITVNEVQSNPVLASIGNQTVNELTELAFTATATDPDGGTLTFSLANPASGTYPTGASITPGGAFAWTPTEAQGPGTYRVKVVVSDGNLADEEEIEIKVAEVNVAPVLAAIGNQSVAEGATLSFAATATDSDLPANTLTFSLVGTVPAGAGITSGGAFTWSPADGPASATFKVRVTDNGSPALYDEEEITITVTNVNPTAAFSAPSGSVAEGQTFVLSLSNESDVPADQPTLKFAFDCGDGLGYHAASTTATLTCPALDDPGQNVKGKVVDKDGGYTEYTDVVTITNVAPVLSLITITPSSVIAIGTTITANATFTDAGVKDTHTAAYAWGDGSSSTTATISEVNGAGSASAQHTYGAAGVYVVTLTLRDKDGAEVSVKYEYVVVYDPSAGFVTGGGWINSPVGAYVPNPTLTGKATFGFVSKYKKGMTTPDGSTEFQFHAAGMNFKSAAYEWLVLSGARAQFKGTGTINGAGNYGFLLTAIDGQISGGGGTDRFRIKVWEIATGNVVYDNQLGATDTDPITTALASGSINIQAK